MSDEWHRSITLSACEVHKGETLTLLFPSSCLIFQILQPAQDSGLAWQLSAGPWALTWAMTDAPELPAVACPRSPGQIDHCFRYSAATELLTNTYGRRWILPNAYYLHDKLFFWQHFSSFSFFIYTLLWYSVLLDTSVCTENGNGQHL